MENILELAKTIPLLDRAAAEQATARQLQLTKPTGSLGRLEAIAIQMAGITGEVMPIVPLKAVIVMAADHGVAAVVNRHAVGLCDFSAGARPARLVSAGGQYGY